MMKQRWASIYKCTQLVLSFLLVLVIWNLPQSALADVNPQDINAIIRTRDIALQALNTRDFSKIQPYLHPNFTITTVDNQIFHQVPEFEKYWNQQFSSSIKDIKMQLKGDPIRTFLTPEIDVASGEAIASFSFKDGKTADMALRWTAVLQKLQDKWTIQSLHFSSNLLNNPVLNAAQQLGQILAVAAGIGGFVLGAVAMLLLRRKTKQQTARI
ncbi:nuclear transport factor 2 family protein [Nostoc sp. NMS4]|uniref:YybH family protein n=1 Tax=Nostoc sp. NMS4 TaxID=2815390 RepID=UPI0025E8AA58|nr:nuclear transport factor 2 family protein [Nostoc sp. NMS4]MBN3925849.1 nuclear transport factor 2 family protein [Nostoc sp. NMS4]